MKSRKWLKNKKVIITGVSSGIGRELAIQLVRNYNCDILGVARNVGKLEALKDELGDKFIYHSMDVGKASAWEEFSKSELVNDFCPDILINNAGIIHPFVKFMDLSDDEINRVITTNYLSLIYSCRAMIPILSKSKTPALINVSSASALLPVAGASVYSSTKSAAYSLTDVLREELIGRFYVAAVLPGPVKTNLYEAKNEKGEGKAKVADQKLFESAGITAEKAARKIIRKIRRRKSRIVIGGTAHGMGLFYNLLPESSIRITGKMMRSLPIKTFQNIFAEDEQN